MLSAPTSRSTRSSGSARYAASSRSRISRRSSGATGREDPAGHVGLDDYFRGHENAAALDTLLQEGTVVTCGPSWQSCLQEPRRRKGRPSGLRSARSSSSSPAAMEVMLHRLSAVVSKTRPRSYLPRRILFRRARWQLLVTGWKSRGSHVTNWHRRLSSRTRAGSGCANARPDPAAPGACSSCRRPKT